MGENLNGFDGGRVGKSVGVMGVGGGWVSGGRGGGGKNVWSHGRGWGNAAGRLSGMSVFFPSNSHLCKVQHLLCFLLFFTWV
jgi:hypothetical protein